MNNPFERPFKDKYIPLLERLRNALRFVAERERVEHVAKDETFARSVLLQIAYLKQQVCERSER